MCNHHFTEEEKAAMQARAEEVKARRKGMPKGEQAVLEKIAEMSEHDRSIAQNLHALIRSSFPLLEPRTWYGMPAYAKNGKVLCFFQSAHKFKTRYATLGFTDVAQLDEGVMWPTAFALTAWNDDVEKSVHHLLLKAVG